MLTNANQTIKYNNELKGNNNINKKLTAYNFFYKQQLVYIESMFPFWTPTSEKLNVF